jgi:Predicted thioesterase
MQTFSQTITVSEQQSAAFLGSGILPVFATPAMVAFMENTAMQAMEALLREGECSVGTEVNVRHLKASPVGAEITCLACITQVDGRKVSFEIQATDAAGDIIGVATHQRFIVSARRFMEKLG